MEKDSTNITLIDFQVNLNEPSIYIQSSWWLLGIIILIILIGYILWYRKVRGNFLIHEMSVDISSKPKVSFKVKRSSENLYIANRIYLELITRKAVLPFEEDNDVIIEIYNSWYTLFTTIRNEIKNVSGDYLKSHDTTDALIGLTVNILNDGLRPHLTMYQAKFRKWYSNESEKSENNLLSPQEIQQKHPNYEELIEDLRNVNQILIGYSEELKKLIKG
jgi:hypothetical protein